MFPPAVVDGSAVNARARAAPLVAQHDELLPWNELPGGGSVHAEHSKQLAADVRIVEGAVVWRLDRHVAIALLLLRRDQLTSDENAVEQSLARGVIEQRAGRLSCEAGKGKRWDRRRGIAPRGKRCCEGHGPPLSRRGRRGPDDFRHRTPSRRRASGSVRSADSERRGAEDQTDHDVLVRSTARPDAVLPTARAEGGKPSSSVGAGIKPHPSGRCPALPKFLSSNRRQAHPCNCSTETTRQGDRATDFTRPNYTPGTPNIATKHDTDYRTLNMR
jgi:hypothetical protein